ncbi:MAG: hypothetical protein QXV83_04640 [Candidatus Anstonellaceae archaeon]
MSQEPDVSKFKLKKSSFKFIQLKKYEPKKHFLIKKYQQDPIKLLLENLSKKKDGGKKSIIQQQKVDLKSLVIAHPILMGGAFLVLVVVLFFIFSAMFKPPLLTPIYPSQQNYFSGDLKFKVIDSGVLSFGSLLNPSFEPFIVLDYLPISLKNCSVEALFYSSSPSRHVFVLDYYKDGADTYPAFREKLEKILNKNGWVISDITIDDLKDLPGSSTLLIPTGYMPKRLLGSEGFPSIVDLASRGIVVIYLGQPFDENVFDEAGNIEPVDKEKLNSLNIVFDKKVKISSSDGFSLTMPYYVAKFSESASNLLWGSISVLNVKNGFILFLPQALDGGWGGNSDLAAEDIARLIMNEPYRQPLSKLVVNLNSTSSNHSYKSTIFFGSVPIQEGYIKLIFSMIDEKNISQKKILYWPVFKRSNSNIYSESNLFVPTYLGGQKKVLTLLLNESPVQEVKLFFQIYQDGEIKDSFPVEQAFTKTIVTRAAPLSFSLSPGEYILKVVDSNGKFYAGTKIIIIPIEITITGPDNKIFTAFKEGKFNISFNSNSTKLVVPKVVVYIENKKNALKKEYNSVSNFVYEPNVNFERGDYTFVFDFDGYIQKKVVSFNLPQNMWERTDVQILGAIAILIGLFTLYIISRPKKEMFSLDIPDFGLEEYREIKLNSSQILQVFDLVNREFKWEKMPLSLSELKDGFLKLTLDGHPIVVGEYNLEEILTKLEKRKLVCSNLGYWIPCKWLEELNTNIKKITMYRFLRDIFVTNGIKFSKLRNIKVENYDLKIMVNNIVYYIFLFDGDFSIVSNILKRAQDGNCWIVFEDKSELEKFVDKLSHIVSKNSILLKLYINNSKVTLISIDKLEESIRKLKI